MLYHNCSTQRKILFFHSFFFFPPLLFLALLSSPSIFSFHHFFPPYDLFIFLTFPPFFHCWGYWRLKVILWIYQISALPSFYWDVVNWKIGLELTLLSRLKWGVTFVMCNYCSFLDQITFVVFNLSPKQYVIHRYWWRCYKFGEGFTQEFWIKETVRLERKLFHRDQNHMVQSGFAFFTLLFYKTLRHWIISSFY